jgi:acetyltransferase-like isoleucine patch superfamily enzyme
MKTQLKKIIKFFNTIFYVIFKSNITLPNTSLYFSNLKIANTNFASFKCSEISGTKIFMSGKDNSIEIKDSVISQTNIFIDGNNNNLIVEPHVKLRSATIHIRGNNCLIEIKKGTTFGGIRIVNVGESNNIIIGENCLFADFIELWASDTHSIYDLEGNRMNNEKPVVIGNGVWIGSHVKILKGVTIGNGAIIGMNSMVTKNIAPKTLNVGNPAHCIKENISWTLDYKNNSNESNTYSS